MTPNDIGSETGPQNAVMAGSGSVPLEAYQQRQATAGELLSQIRVLSALVEHCARLAACQGADALAVMQAATRASSSTARLATALAVVSEAEQRQRRIIEVVQSPRTVLPHSNSILDALLSVLSAPELQRLVGIGREALPGASQPDHAAQPV
jgi:hypothetical protein